MQNKKILSTLALATLVTTSFVSAQEQGGPGMPPPPGGEGRPPMNNQRPPHEGGLMDRLFGSFRDERKELREEFREDRKERREWMMGSTTPGTATPTPWKNYKEGMKNLKEDMKGRIASLTEAQMASITAKLGITTEELKAKLSSGTPLREIIGDKIPREDMAKILPPPFASGTIATETRRMFREERRGGFFNNIREKLFGPSDPMADNTDQNDEENENRGSGFANFFKRWFNF